MIILNCIFLNGSALRGAGAFIYGVKEGFINISTFLFRILANT